MKLIKFFILTILTLLTLNNAKAVTTNSLTILAPQNMSFAVTEIIRNYSRNKDITITGSFNTVGTLINNIEEGFPADIIITDHPYWVKELKQRGLVNIASITNLVEDQMVLIINNNYYDMNQDMFENLRADNNIEKKQKLYKNFALALPKKTTSLIGTYAMEIIDNSELFDVSSLKMIEYENLNEVISNTDYPLIITSHSDSYDNPNINILESFENNLHQRFIYQIAIIASENMEEAEKFIAYLTSEPVLNIFKKYGFEIIE